MGKNGSVYGGGNSIRMLRKTEEPPVPQLWYCSEQYPHRLRCIVPKSALPKLDLNPTQFVRKELLHYGEKNDLGVRAVLSQRNRT